MQASRHRVLLNAGKPDVHVVPEFQPGEFDLGPKLGGRPQQVVVRLPACLPLLVLPLLIEPGLLASELGLLTSSGGPIGQRDSTETPEKRSDRRDQGQENREVEHAASLYTTARMCH